MPPTNKAKTCYLGFQILQISMYSASVGCARPSTRYGGPASQFKGSAANSLVPDTPLRLQGFCLCPYESVLFWQHKGNLNNIKQQVLMLWLIYINKVNKLSSKGKHFLIRTYLLCRSNLDILVNDQPQPSESQANGLSPGNRKLNFFFF